MCLFYHVPIKLCQRKTLAPVYIYIYIWNWIDSVFDVCGSFFSFCLFRFIWANAWIPVHIRKPNELQKHRLWALFVFHEKKKY